MYYLRSLFRITKLFRKYNRKPTPKQKPPKDKANVHRLMPNFRKLSTSTVTEGRENKICQHTSNFKQPSPEFPATKS